MLHHRFARARGGAQLFGHREEDGDRAGALVRRGARDGRDGRGSRVRERYGGRSRGADAGVGDRVSAYPRAEGPSVHELPERLEVADALPRGECLRKVLEDKLRERYSGTVK
ncbi:hypothetical protein GCM10027073_51560 [Streptomyces chlorus]